MRNPKVEWFFNKEGQWQEAYQELRDIVLDCGLTEELKWGCPCYAQERSNIVLIHGFKDYCALLFMQGALLKDPNNMLVQQTANVQSARQLRFSEVEEIIKSEAIIKAYIKEAIKNDKAGLKVVKKTTTEFNVPQEFQAALDEMHELKMAFGKLTPGRQRGYLLYFSAAKQSKTRMERVEKHIINILDNKGLDE
ncbi:hypothetical protein EOD41_04320 [Mucilaginibacter limnophilus]|uniref:YdhG-like domain-containing protein n=1 Tax=Mucilaginibacter limnophilus TaxID=1932778 RepID=A0A3S3THJ8_9SPHI|nr:DUF1801 domain-containing protein [Mucilaginibacter limnophilus]RVU01199.1 hypothetical protein EOD41_04320 [Mucilaginibacter limnophilus]